MQIDLTLEQTINADAVNQQTGISLSAFTNYISANHTCIRVLSNLGFNRKQDASTKLQGSKQRKNEKHSIPSVL